MRQWGDLWKFSTRAVEGRGGRLKHIGRRMICWRRRSNGKYKRMIRDNVVSQTYTSAPEYQLMRASCAREDRAHSQKRSRVATTGRATLVRSGAKLEAMEKPSMGGELQPEFVKKMCIAAHDKDRKSVLWRA